MTDQPSQGATVVKVGGSLLDLPDLVPRLLTVVDNVSLPVVLVGGGPSADLVRQWDRDCVMSDEEAHHLAIAAMSFNALQMVSSEERLVLVDCLEQAAEATASGKVGVLDAWSVVRQLEARSVALPAIPRSWDVTSDSIAAWLARAWNADLWLLKSVELTDVDKDIDQWFFTISNGIGRVCWLNLRLSAGIPIAMPLPASVRP